MKLQISIVTVLAALGVTSPVLGQVKIDPTWLTWDAATTTATFKLIAGMQGGKSPFNFNGFIDDELTLVVPENATVVMNFINEDGVPHSAEVIDAKLPVPNMSGEPAIPRAYTRKALEGLNQGETDVMRFKAAPAGDYRIFCGVPGHGISGMYIGFAVRSDVKEPRLDLTPKKTASQ
jgi:uncharacterized cupredoxin-like copper-binding protein